MKDPKHIVSARRSVWGLIPYGTAWRHKKSGGMYVVTGVPILEANATPMVMYVGHQDGDNLEWLRPVEEFLEKFERI